MISEIATQKVEISSALISCDMSDIRLALVVLVSDVKNKQIYFGAIIRVSHYSFDDSIQKKKPLPYLEFVFVLISLTNIQ